MRVHGWNHKPLHKKQPSPFLHQTLLCHLPQILSQHTKETNITVSLLNCLGKEYLGLTILDLEKKRNKLRVNTFLQHFTISRQQNIIRQKKMEDMNYLTSTPETNLDAYRHTPFDKE